MKSTLAQTTTNRVAQECSIPREFQGARLVRDYPSTVKFNSGDRVYYGCRDAWKGDCEAPPPVIGSNAYLVDKYAMMTSFSSGDKVYYSCNVGYTARAGSRSRRCKNGKWTQLKLKCEQFTCPPPNVPHAYWMGAHREKFNAMDVISIDCDRGYSIQGPTSITCSRDGRWIPSLPSCQPGKLLLFIYFCKIETSYSLGPVLIYSQWCCEGFLDVPGEDMP
uniref:Sushi domain-containing protein n=1 Tax=Oryzias latipes TaxID=8090 RepID=A0A3B3HS54_ORYLA